MTLLQHHVLALWLTALASLGLGLLVFLSDPKRLINKVFTLYAVSIAWWGISESFEVSAASVDVAAIWNVSKFIGVCFIAPAFLHTVILLVGDQHKAPRALAALGYGVGIAFMVLRYAFPHMVVGEPQPVAYMNYYTPLTPLGSLLPVIFFVMVNAGFVRLWHALKHSTGQRQTQIKYLFWSSVIGYVGGSADWAPSFGFSIPFLNPFGIYTVSLYSLATAYAVLRHRLFDVYVVIQKSLIYSLLVTTLTIGYFGLVYLVERFFQTTLGYRSVELSLSAFALMALFFQPLKISVQRLVDRLFFRAPHEELVKRMERLEQEVRHADKLKAISTLAAGMAHEIKNPLTSIKTFTESLETHYEDPSFRAKFQKIVSGEVERINLIVQQLLNFAKPASPHLEFVPVRRLLDETLDFMSSECLKRRVEVDRRYDANDTIQADPQQLRQVFLNLFLNSLESMNGSGGQLSVSTVRDRSRLAVTINDTGHGISKEQLQHIFDPFFTTKQGGTGLGLSVVHSIITEHRGTIAFDSQLHHGTTCKLTFPLR